MLDKNKEVVMGMKGISKNPLILAVMTFTGFTAGYLLAGLLISQLTREGFAKTTFVPVAIFVSAFFAVAASTQVYVKTKRNNRNSK